MCEVLAMIAEHAPVSPNKLAEIGIACRQDIDYYIRELKRDKLIHIAAYETSPCRDGYTVKLYATGNLADAKRPKPPRKPYKRKPTEHADDIANAIRNREERRQREIEHIPARDFLTAALFGGIAA
jgi:hypothetical protein